MSEVEPKAHELSLAWASYVLGHNARTFRMWQFVYWLSLGPSGHFMSFPPDWFPQTLKEIELATLALQGKISGEVCERIRKCFQANVDTSEEEFDVPNGQATDWMDWGYDDSSRGHEQSSNLIKFEVPDSQATDWMYWGYDESSYGHEQWSNLIKLVAETLSEVKDLRGWWRLGDALGEFQHDLQFQNPNARLGQSLSIRPTLRCAATLYDQGHTGIAEIEELMLSYRSRSWMPTEQLLAVAVGTDENVVRRTSTSTEAIILVAKQATELDLRLRAALSDYDQSEAETLSETIGDKATDAISFTKLELDILNALKNVQLKTEELAKIVSEGDTKRLFGQGKNKRGLNRLKTLELVKNDRGYGYYSTKYPPPEWLEYS